MKIGIIGLPNVGKSTLFNALANPASAPPAGGAAAGEGKLARVENRPFTTIEPNVGVVSVPDERLEKLAAMHKSAKIVPTSIEFVDIAGLVRGAHKGEGLGNKFLSHIREVDAIAHVVRFFNDPNVTHVDGSPDPLRDVDNIETELALADLATVERALEKAADDAKARKKGASQRLAILERLQTHLADGLPARTLELQEKERMVISYLPLLTNRPTLYIPNVSEEQIIGAEEITRAFAAKYSPALPISIKIEQEIVELPDDERATFLAEYGLRATGLNRLIKASYKLLDLVTFLTTGPDETRAWTLPRGASAPQAAGKIHSDMQRGFIRAEVVTYTDLIAAGSYAAARAAGKVRDEGKEYIVQDGDVMIIKFSV